MISCKKNFNECVQSDFNCYISIIVSFWCSLGRFCSTELFSLTVVFKFQEMSPKAYFQLTKHISMIVKIDKKMLLVLGNRTYIYTHFDAQNAGNSVSELLDFKFFWGRHAPRPPLPCGPLSIPSPTLLKLAVYFKLYWNPCWFPQGKLTKRSGGYKYIHVFKIISII